MGETGCPFLPNNGAAVTNKFASTGEPITNTYQLVNYYSNGTFWSSNVFQGTSMMGQDKVSRFYKCC